MSKLTNSLAVLALLSSPLSAQSQVSGRSDDRAQPGTFPVEEIRAMLQMPGVNDVYLPEMPLGLGTDLADLKTSVRGTKR